MSIARLAGVAAMAERYDGFILDLWGVVHDGQKPYPGALACMAHLRRQGKPLLLLSNAPRRAVDVLPHLAQMGVNGDHFDDLLTSGDLTRHAVETGSAKVASRHYFHLGPERDWRILEGLDCRKVATLDASDFVLCSGLFNDETEAPEDYRDVLAEARRLDLTMLCANPDLVVMRGPKVVPCAGLLAKAYEEQGGRVQYYGKPHLVAYEACLARLGLPAARLLAVGDTLRTDIRGANGAGIDSVLVTGGIHADDWNLEPGSLPDDGQIAAACQLWGATPTGIIASLRW